MSRSFPLEEGRAAMEAMRFCLQSKYDFAEIYSPPRIVMEANGMARMKGGFSLDLTAPDSDNYVWDLGKHECRQRAYVKIRDTVPYMTIGSQSAPRSRPSRT